MTKEWKQMTTAEKRTDLRDKWMNPPEVKFDSLEAEKSYKSRVQRFLDALNMKKPDRVPVFPMFGFFAAYYSGMTPYDMMYDYDKLKEAFIKYIVDLDPDAQSGVMIAPPGKVHEILDYQLYSWPGHGVPKHASYQAREGEYMKADEYDALIDDPTLFFLTTWLPRVMGKLDGLTHLSPFTNMTEMYGGFTSAALVPFGVPPVQESLKALMAAGDEALKWIGVAVDYHSKMVAMGYPGFMGGGCKAPFDTIGDTLRGTKGMILDMYRQPDKLLRALDQFTPIMIKMGVAAARQNGIPIVFIPLHKGADGFMNDQQFKKFYWPSLKAVFEGLLKEGCIPFPWAEGGYNSRLEVIKDTPDGVIWGFDKVDMVKVHKLLGNRLCIGGNMQISTLALGKTEGIKAEVKKLIDDCAKDGGFIMLTGATIEDVPPANVKTFIDATKEYGVYK
jgi:uroporphyrinogen-III decarboxylase